MSKKIAYSGILLALNILIFLMLNIFPTNTIFLLGLSSLPISIIIMEWGPKIGATFYIASVILGFISITNKVHWIIYFLMFGIYGLIKYLIEQDKSIYMEYILKIVYANMMLVIAYIILKQFVYIPTKWYLVLFFNIIFLVYDYAYSLFIDYYNQKLKHIIKKL